MKILDVPSIGKRGVVVGQGGRFGQISRSLTIPADPKTPIQIIMRSNLAKVARSWRTLTQAEQNAWISDAGGTLSALKCGTQGYLLGSQLYSKINCINLLCGNDIVRVPPLRPGFGQVIATAFNLTHAAGVLTFQLVTVGEPTRANPWIVRASPPQSFGCNKCDDLRIIGLAPVPQNGLCDISALYIARYGVPPVGCKVWVSLCATESGWQDIPREFMQPVPPAT